MPSSLFVVAACNASFATASTTVYGGALNGSPDANISQGATEAAFQGSVAFGGAISNYAANVFSNARASSSSTIGINKGGTTVLTVTYAASTTGVQTDTSSVAVAQNDLLSSFVTLGSGTGNFNTVGECYRFDATSGTKGSTGANSISATPRVLSDAGPVSRYINISAVAGSSLVEGDSRTSIPIGLTASYLQLYCSAYTRTGTTVVNLLKNGSAVTNTISFTGTGLVKDTTHTDSVAAADTLGIEIQLPSLGGNFQYDSYGFWYDATVAGEGFTSSGTAAGATITAGSTGNSPIGGRLAFLTTGEARTQFTPGTAGTLSKFGVTITINASSATATFKSRKNTADGNQSFTVTAAATGFFSDSSNTDVYTPSDILNTQVTGVTTSTITAVSQSFKNLTTVPAARNALALMGVG